MKCIKSERTGEIRRVSNEEAADKVEDAKFWEPWAYCPKSEWKAQQKKEG